MRVLLVSAYELGHQPVHAASPAAVLRHRGHDVRVVDLAVEEWDTAQVDWADAIAFSVPMHTAMRLALRGAEAVRAQRPDLPICLYGLYAGVSRDRTVGGGLVDRVLAGEYEPALVDWVQGPEDPATTTVVHLGRTSFHRPARDLLPPLGHYAHLALGGEERLVGAVEASHGCASRCRHCPVPTVYDGRTRIVAADVVVDDVAQLVAAGARHVTFADPDFLNAVHHSRRIVRAVHERFPDLTFDCTTKVELILRHEWIWAEMAASGCLFVVSAFESVDEATLLRLDKGHTAADAVRAIALLRRHGIEIRPSFLPFTPWTTLDGLVDLLDFVAACDLVGNVDPVQYTIRLLLPEGSLLVDHPDVRPHLGPYDADRLSWTWTHPDPTVDALQAELAARVEASAATDEPTSATYLALAGAVRHAAGRPPPIVAGSTAGRPRLTEPWFCCAEPTEGQLGPLRE